MGTLHDELRTFVICLCNEERDLCEAEERADLNITTERVSSVSYELNEQLM